MIQKKFRKISSKYIESIVIFALVTCILMLLFKLYDFAPFGNNHLAWADASIQYLDFFAYLKDVFSGKNNIFYTFGKTLGGNNIAVFSYYLSSPFNFLVVFFEKDQLINFFDILVMLKLGTAAVTFSCFLRGRFGEQISGNVRILLAISYSMCQYSIAQSSNIMWLDGVYMLPLMLLGIYKLLKNKTIAFLSITVGFSIIFNWYTGGINCIFAILWFLYELACLLVDKQTDASFRPQKEIFLSIGHLISAMAIGIMLSACLFLPTIAALQGGRAGFEWGLFKNVLTGDIFTVIQGNTLGASSAVGRVSLFCGSIGLIGCAGFFILKQISVKKKVITGVFLATVILLFYWQPLIAIFSLMKVVGSYWYRYSYVGIIAVLFIAAQFYKEYLRENRIVRKVLVNAVGFSILLFIINCIYPLYENKKIFMTIVSLMSISLFLICFARCKKRLFRTGAFIVLSALLIVELSYNAKLLMKQYSYSDREAYTTYVSEQQKQIDKIKSFDHGNYRMTQTSPRMLTSEGLTAFYNEALAYNYWSLSGYTSDPDNIQREFLDKLGYRMNGENMCIVNTPILAADSLLNVKYVLSEYPIPGLTLVKNIEQYNDKNVYENPYVLPFVFSYSREGKNDIDEATNPFEYQNFLYGQLIGEPVDLYKAVEYECVKNEKGYFYHFNIPDGNYAVYGNLEWETEQGGTLRVNNCYEMGYAKWLSPSVFSIPVNKEEKEAIIQLESDGNLVITDAQFYVLDLDRLAEISQEIKLKSGEVSELRNGYLRCTIQGKEQENAYISIPYETGWRVFRNGEEIEPELFAECMMSIPLEKGANIIEMLYLPPALFKGIVVTGLGSFVLFILGIGRKSRTQDRK